jgi:hypothetical protein
MASVLGAISARSKYDTTLTLGHPRGRRSGLMIDPASLLCKAAIFESGCQKRVRLGRTQIEHSESAAPGSAYMERTCQAGPWCPEATELRLEIQMLEIVNDISLLPAEGDIPKPKVTGSSPVGTANEIK